MVRGGQSKNDSAEIDNLFQLTASDWVSNEESEDDRETIFNNEWFGDGLEPKSKASYRVALRKWLRYSSELAQVNHFIHWPCASDDIHASCPSGMRQ